MKFEIREISHSDLPGIHDLYKEIYSKDTRKVKPLTELKWLFADPDEENKLLGFVAYDENSKLIGVIGYVISKYCINNRIVTGVIPRSWMVSPAYRGMLGFQLLLKVIKLADFAFTIQGSAMAQSSYKAVRLNHIFDAHVYFKVFNPMKFFLSSEKKSFKEMIRGLYYFSLKPCVSKGKKLSLAENSNVIPSPGSNHDDFSVIEDSNRIKWLMQCPLLDSYSYTILEQGKQIGIALCYIRITRKNLLRARIVYISYLGREEYRWTEILKSLEKSLRDKGCCSISVLAANSTFTESLKKNGYKTSSRANKSVYLRDDAKRLEGIQLNEWHMTFYEGDKGYRDI